MTTLEQLDRWHAAGTIGSEQHAALSRLVRRDRVSLYVELNVVLYLGVLAFAGGLAWTAQTYSRSWGDAAILAPGIGLLAGCAYYVTTRVQPYSSERVPPPGFAFDYVLYLGCLVFAVVLGYIEYRFGLLQERWDSYLLASAALYFALAYRCDNRFVLSLAIATLGGWLGVRFTRADLFVAASLRVSAVLYSLIAGLAGAATYRAAQKRHFLETYLHVAANVLFAALVSGVFDVAGVSMWLVGLLCAAGLAVTCGVMFRRFVFVVYGTVYGYIGLSREALRHLRGDTAGFTYIVLSSCVVMAALVLLARRAGRDA